MAARRVPLWTLERHRRRRRTLRRGQRRRFGQQPGRHAALRVWRAAALPAQPRPRRESAQRHAARQQPHRPISAAAAAAGRQRLRVRERRWCLPGSLVPNRRRRRRWWRRRQQHPHVQRPAARLVRRIRRQLARLRDFAGEMHPLRVARGAARAGESRPSNSRSGFAFDDAVRCPPSRALTPSPCAPSRHALTHRWAPGLSASPSSSTLTSALPRATRPQ